MHTVKVYARGVSSPQSMATDIEEQMEAYHPEAYTVTVVRSILCSGEYHVAVQVEGLEHHVDKRGTMDLLFEDILQVVVNFHADNGASFTLLENVYRDVGIILADLNVQCTCGDGVAEAAEQILKEET